MEAILTQLWENSHIMLHRRERLVLHLHLARRRKQQYQGHRMSDISNIFRQSSHDPYTATFTPFHSVSVPSTPRYNSRKRKGPIFLSMSNVVTLLSTQMVGLKIFSARWFVPSLVGSFFRSLAFVREGQRAIFNAAATSTLFLSLCISRAAAALHASM